jgi:CheY-like chemotaxis protein
MSTDNRVIAVVSSLQEFQQIYDTLAADGVVVQHASCVLGAVLARAYGEITALAEAPPDGPRNTAQTLAQHPVILYDIDPDDLHGWREALRQILSLYADARVIFASRLADEDLWVEVLKTGGHDLLSKPFSESELRQAVQRALDPSKMLATAA